LFMVKETSSVLNFKNECQTYLMTCSLLCGGKDAIASSGLCKNNKPFRQA